LNELNAPFKEDEPFKTLTDYKKEQGQEFMANAYNYNQRFQFASATTVRKEDLPPNVYPITINGQISYQFGRVRADNERPQFAQIHTLRDEDLQTTVNMQTEARINDYRQLENRPATWEPNVCTIN